MAPVPTTQPASARISVAVLLSCIIDVEHLHATLTRRGGSVAAGASSSVSAGRHPALSPVGSSFDNSYSGRVVVISPTTVPQPSHLRWNDAKSELPVLIVFNFRSVTCLPCGATVAHPSCSRFRRYQMIVVFCRDNPHVSYLVRTPAEKSGHDVLALPVSAFAQMPGVLPNFQPLFECEFERNAAAFGAILVLIVFLFPFAHGEPYWLRMILTRCRAGGIEDLCLLREVRLAPFQHR
jgi:hypothetical protein